VRRGEFEGERSTSELSVESFVRTLCAYLTAVYILGFLVVVSGLGSRMGFVAVQMIAAGVVCSVGSSPRRALVRLAYIAQIYLLGYLLFFWNYDLSWDGNTYHLSMVEHMLAGWRVFEPIEPVSWRFFVPGVKSTAFVSGFDKNAELLFAAFSAPFGLADFGRIAKLLFLEIGVASAILFARRFLKLSALASVLFACAVVLNPVVIAQMFTLYVDDVLYLLLASFVFLWLAGEEPLSLVVLAFGLGVKFSALLFFGPLLAALLAVNKLILRRPLPKARARYVVVLAVMACMGLSYCAYNLATRHHPFYPLNEADIMVFQVPEPMKRLGKFERFAVSYLSFPGWMSLYDVGREAGLAELLASGLRGYFDAGAYRSALRDCLVSTDCRVGGFGLLWPLLLVFSVVALVARVLELVMRRRTTEGGGEARALLAVSAALLFTVLAFPDCWWARYVPHLWCVPLLVAGLFCIERRGHSLLVIFVAALMIANSAAILPFAVGKNKRAYDRFNAQVDSIRSAAECGDAKTIYTTVSGWGEFEFAPSKQEFFSTCPKRSIMSTPFPPPYVLCPLPSGPVE